MIQVVKRHRWWIVIGVGLLAAAYGILSVHLYHQREQRIAQRVTAIGGTTMFRYFGPRWIPEAIQDKLPFMNRIQYLGLRGPDAPEDLLSEVGSLRYVETLDLGGTAVTDTGLKYLSRMTSVERLAIWSSQVTDAGLIHLKGMHLVELHAANTQITDAGLGSLKDHSMLIYLSLTNTRTTPEGRARLRKALPRCRILPAP